MHMCAFWFVFPFQQQTRLHVAESLGCAPPPLALAVLHAYPACALHMQVAIRTQQAQVVRVVVDALLEGRFSQASVMQHLYGALMALIHDPQVGSGARAFIQGPPAA